MPGPHHGAGLVLKVRPVGPETTGCRSCHRRHSALKLLVKLLVGSLRAEGVWP